MPLFRYTQDVEDAVEQWDGLNGPPNDWSRQRPQGIEVFKNPFFEKVLGRAHPITPIVWFGVPIVYFTIQGIRDHGVLAGLGLFVVGVLLWTLVEYVLHRFLFHYIGEGHQTKFRQFMIHGYHHEFPNDRWRLVAPPMMSWPVGLALGGLFYLVFGPLYFGPLLAGTMVGYIAYDWIHYYTHHARPKTWVGKFLRRYHMEHHYKDGDSHFGITSPLWDFVFGTFRSKQHGKRETATEESKLAS